LSFAIRFGVGKGMLHDDRPWCIFNRRTDRKLIREAVRNARLCDSCFQTLTDRFDQEQSRSVRLILDTIAAVAQDEQPRLAYTQQFEIKTIRRTPRRGIQAVEQKTLPADDEEARASKLRGPVKPAAPPVGRSRSTRSDNRRSMTPMGGAETIPTVVPRSVFISYSHADKSLVGQLRTHLAPLERRGLISSWSDQQILPGERWDQAISTELEAADVILLLISAHFMDSEYCWGKEMERALQRHDDKEAVVIPVIGHACNWHGARFAKLLALPSDGRPVTSWQNINEAWEDVSRGIERAVSDGFQPSARR
jgi:hypothetical protein